MQAVIAIFGIAWLGDTFFQANLAQIQPPLERMVERAPWLFAVALFAMSILLYSQAATVRALGPLGVALGLPPFGLIGVIPGGERLLRHPQLPDRGRGHQLRPHRDHAASGSTC